MKRLCLPSYKKGLCYLLGLALYVNRRLVLLSRSVFVKSIRGSLPIKYYLRFSHLAYAKLDLSFADLFCRF